MEVIDLGKKIHAFVWKTLDEHRNLKPSIHGDTFAFIQQFLKEDYVQDPVIILQNNCYNRNSLQSHGFAFLSLVRIYPEAIGDNIGRGTLYIKIDATKKELLESNLEHNLVSTIRKNVFLGKKRNPSPPPLAEAIFPEVAAKLNTSDAERLYPSLFTAKDVIPLFYLSLGGNENFIEIREGEDSKLWIVVHHSTRLLAKFVYDYYKEAKAISSGGLGTPIKSKLGQTYLREMRLMESLADTYRKILGRLTLSAIGSILGRKVTVLDGFSKKHASVELTAKGFLHRVGTTRLKASGYTPLLTSHNAPMYLYETNLDALEDFGESLGCVPSGTGLKLGTDLRPVTYLPDEYNSPGIIEELHHRVLGNRLTLFPYIIIRETSQGYTLNPFQSKVP